MVICEIDGVARRSLAVAEARTAWSLNGVVVDVESTAAARRVGSPDYNADCKVNFTDLLKETPPLSGKAYSFFSDFDGDGDCDLNDAAILTRPASVGATCSR
jgi:hypothetical protein